ncbi:MAG: type IV pilin [Candidatus Bathyarchaeota archaeon]|nr:type IV pilin [Candidatus Bathyarchaeota archaeon]
MKNILKNRWALSTVVTTLIILVVSVLLAGVVTYFAINVTSTRVQEESLHLTKQHVWYAANGTSYSSEAAIMIINTGGRDVVIDKLTVRGQEISWSNVFYNVTTDSVSADLTFNTTLVDGGEITIGTTDYIFEQASTDLTLESGKTMIIYIASPDSITVNDIGLTVAITVFTSQAMYYKETNVEAS